MTRYIMISNYERLNSATDTQLVKGEILKECARACDRDETLTWYFRSFIGGIQMMRAEIFSEFSRTKSSKFYSISEIVRSEIDLSRMLESLFLTSS